MTHYTQINDEQDYQPQPFVAGITSFPEPSGYEPPESTETMENGKLADAIRNGVISAQQKQLQEQHDYLVELTAERDKLRRQRDDALADAEDMKGRINAILEAIAESDLSQLNFYFQQTRAVGHTHAMINGITDKCEIVIAANHAHAQAIQRQMFENGKLFRPCFVSLGKLEALMGVRAPAVLDHFTMTQVFARLIKDVARAASGAVKP